MEARGDEERKIRARALFQAAYAHQMREELEEALGRPRAMNN